MKNSVQREAILRELRGMRNHPTAEELYSLLKPRMPRLSLATVYRNLEQFSRAGLVLKLDCGGALKRFDGNTEPHPHLRCPICGRVSDLEDRAVEQIQEELLRLLPSLHCGSVNIEFGGECRECKKNREEAVS